MRVVLVPIQLEGAERNGHAPPPIRSRKSYRSADPRCVDFSQSAEGVTKDNDNQSPINMVPYLIVVGLRRSLSMKKSISECFRGCSSFNTSQHFTSDNQTRILPTISIIITWGTHTPKWLPTHPKWVSTSQKWVTTAGCWVSTSRFQFNMPQKRSLITWIWGLNMAQTGLNSWILSAQQKRFCSGNGDKNNSQHLSRV